MVDEARAAEFPCDGFVPGGREVICGTCGWARWQHAIEAQHPERAAPIASDWWTFDDLQETDDDHWPTDMIRALVALNEASHG